MEEINELAFKLHDLLLESEEYKALKKIEKEMLQDEKASLLIKNYEQAMLTYVNDKSEQVLKNMHQCKLDMDSNEIILKYKKAYKEYQILVGKITDIAFEDFAKPSLIDQIIRTK